MCTPHDTNRIKDALMRAVLADHGEATRRMQAMRRYLRDHGVRQWAADFLAALGTNPRAEAGGVAERSPA